MKPKLPADFRVDPDGRSQVMAVEIPFGIFVRRNISEQCDVFSQENQVKPTRVDGGKLVVWAELLQHFGASVPSSRTTEL